MQLLPCADFSLNLMQMNSDIQQRRKSSKGAGEKFMYENAAHHYSNRNECLLNSMWFSVIFQALPLCCSVKENHIQQHISGHIWSVFVFYHPCVRTGNERVFKHLTHRELTVLITSPTASKMTSLSFKSVWHNMS